MPHADHDWDDIFVLTEYLTAINAQTPLPRLDPDLTLAFTPLIAIRDIVQASLAQTDNWTEYYVALAICALRAMTWNTLSIGNRRLMLLLAALAIGELYMKPGASGSSDLTKPDDDTEFPTN
jgi:hypothetical protein